ncbi:MULTISPECIES: hypothetical protein [unclassified Streptomyces]|uniref:hypothetical protein n=1 Tax=unclassified Streptomyces TaxID=2593676 RepID=UPI000DDB289F|nr:MULTISPECIES: hypothetical protein [unclassified Streptomyces]QZZ26544.1 hypothetical protein A7X85_10000 [Streptomyces sp. ST1015]
MSTLAVGQYTATTISTAGFALGLALLGTELWRWHKGGKGKGDDGGGAAKDPKALIPLASGIVSGILMIACPAGLLGSLADMLRWGGNSVGDFAMHALTGTRSTTFGGAAAPRIDDKGAVVVTALFVALFLLRKSFAKVVKGKWKKGALIGVLLSVSTGVAAIVAQQVTEGANGIGAWALGGLATWSPV